MADHQTPVIEEETEDETKNDGSVHSQEIDEGKAVEVATSVPSDVDVNVNQVPALSEDQSLDSQEHISHPDTHEDNTVTEEKQKEVSITGVTIEDEAHKLEDNGVLESEITSTGVPDNADKDELSPVPVVEDVLEQVTADDIADNSSLDVAGIAKETTAEVTSEVKIAQDNTDVVMETTTEITTDMNITQENDDIIEDTTTEVTLDVEITQENGDKKAIETPNHLQTLEEENEDISDEPELVTENKSEIVAAIDDRDDSPIIVSERLSRTPTPVHQHDVYAEHLEPSSPQPPVGSEIDDLERPYSLDELEISRDQIVEQLQEAQAYKEQLQAINYQMQSRLGDYFRRKKSEDSRQELERNNADQEQRYLKYMANLEELHKQYRYAKETFEYEIEQNRIMCEAKHTQVEMDQDAFKSYRLMVSEKSKNSRSGKSIPLKDLQQYEQLEGKKEVDVVNVRLENIKLKNRLSKKEQQLKSKEELAEGLHLIDFEQLKIENQTYNEKIEERNEELLKLRKKITSTVQVLTHLKEKLQCVQGENTEATDELKSIEKIVAQKRDVLSRIKQIRDALRIDNQKLRENCGLLGNKTLLLDFEKKNDELSSSENRLIQLKTRHAANTLSCRQVRQKIDQVRLEFL